MPSPRSPSSTGHQDEVPTVGSPGDIKQRIRAFYGFWLGKTEDIAGAGEIALEPDSIEVRQSLLSFEDQTRYNAGELYDASGFVRRSFFDHRYSELLHEHGSLNEYPSFFARGKPIHQRSADNQRLSDTSWASEALDFERFSVSIGDESWIHPNAFCLPRRVTLRTILKTPRNLSPEMSKWMREERSAFPPNALYGCFSYWTQLPGRLDISDELTKGSPLTPFFSLFRLELEDEHGSVKKAVLVRFLIIPDRDGVCRPWSTQDPTPHLPALPAPQHRVTFQLCRRSTAPEQNGPLQLRAEATCPPWLEPPRDGSGNSGQGSNHRGPLNLNDYHKQLAPPPSPHDPRRDPPPHPPSHTLSHRQRFNYRQSFAAGNL